MDSRPDQGHVTHSLESWKANLLRVWSKNTARAMRNEDLTCFSTVFDTPIEVIKASLDQMGAGDHAQGPLSACVLIDPDFNVTMPMSMSKGKGRAIASESSNYFSWFSDPGTYLELTPASLSSVENPTNTDQNLSFDQSYCVDSSVAMSSSSDRPYSSTSGFAPRIAGESSMANQYAEARNVPSDPQTYISRQSMLLKCIDKDIRARRRKGCGQFDRSISQRGDVPCTLGCGRLFRSACDRSRHEETVYPQKYWACDMCMDPDNPSRSDLFIRLDKIRDHNVKKHLGRLCINLCKVDMARTIYPKECGICPYRFRSQHDRSSHIITQHLGSRKNQTTIHQTQREQIADARHAEPDKSFLRSLNSGTRSEYPTPSFVAYEHSWGGEPLSNVSTPDNVSVVHFRPLAATTTPGMPAPSSRLLAVQWSDETQGEGAFGKVLKVEIALDHHWEHISKPRGFACKQMWSHEELFEQEVQCFEYLSAIRPRPAIVECYGTFDHLDDQGRRTRNLLLEHADGNLWQYWSRTLPPRTSAEVAMFYSQLFNISAALSSIHQVTDNDAGRALMRHGDIKPENILHFPDNSVTSHVWKLADFGLSKMSRLEEKRKSHSTDVLAILDTCMGGTAGYTPPETDASMTTIGSICALQRTDIWSFGCVLSLAATWTLKGFSGVQQFQNSRRVAAQRAQRGRLDCFHDGTNVLPEVRAWHNYLRSSISHADSITAPLLDLIDEQLLQADRDMRPSASVLYDQLMRILQRAKREPPSFTTKHLVVADQIQQGYDIHRAPTTALTSSSLAMDVVETASKFWDSAIGDDILDAPETLCLNGEPLLQ